MDKHGSNGGGILSGWHFSLFALGLGIAAGSCIYDPDKLCADGEVYDGEFYRCICPEGHEVTDDGCRKCGKHEELRGGSCQCKSGYTLEKDKCVEEVEVGDGGIAEEEMLPEHGTACSTDDDCAGSEEETYCEAGHHLMCLQVGCNMGGDDCPTGSSCVDFTMFDGPSAVCAPDICGEAALFFGGSEECPDGMECCQAPGPNAYPDFTVCYDQCP